MRGTRPLILIVILTAFAAGYLALSYQSASMPDPSLAQIATTRQEITLKQKPLLQFKISEIYPQPGRAELLDPRMAMPRSTHFSYSEISALYRERLHLGSLLISRDSATSAPFSIK